MSPTEASAILTRAMQRMEAASKAKKQAYDLKQIGAVIAVGMIENLHAIYVDADRIYINSKKLEKYIH